MSARLSQFVELVRLEQTLFALPFAYCGMLLAGRGLPTLWQFFWITCAMFGARTAGMAANRLIDCEIDALNPRTAERALPAKRMRPEAVLGLTLASLGLLLVAARQLNPLCFKLAPLAVLLLLGYSYTKRFTWACHLGLGLVQACAPIGGWLAIAGSFAPTPLFLGAASFLWVAGFDILYACQDMTHDRRVGLHSIPAELGMEKAFWVSRSFHCGTMAALIGAGVASQLSTVYFMGLGLIGSFLIWEHWMLAPNQLGKIQQAFFHANVMISLTLLAVVSWEVLL